MPSAAYSHLHFRLDFIMKANAMNLDQTAPLEELQFYSEPLKRQEKKSI